MCMPVKLLDILAKKHTILWEMMLIFTGSILSVLVTGFEPLISFLSIDIMQYHN